MIADAIFIIPKEPCGFHKDSAGGRYAMVRLVRRGSGSFIKGFFHRRIAAAMTMVPPVTSSHICVNHPDRSPVIPPKTVTAMR